MTDRPITFDRGQDKRPRANPLEDLLDLDGKLIYMLSRRSKLVQRNAKGRQVLDRETEKRLWANFEEAARAQNLDQRMARQLFALLGSFGLETPEGRRSADKPFTMVPRSEAADIDISGPRSLALTRMLAVLAAATGQNLRLTGVVLNDPLIELVKGLNQAGAHLSWTDDRLESQPDASHKSGREAGEFGPLRFEDILIFCGDEPFTLYALIAFALREAGRSKFAGGAELKLLDLRPLETLLPKLGARLASMNPRSRGLPVRLESGGDMAARIELAADTPPLFAQALALAAWSYPEGLRLALSADPAAALMQAKALDEALEALALCGIKAKRQDNEYVVPAGKPKVPYAPELPLDSALAAYLLALPAFAGGVAKLSGTYVPPKALAADLAALGLAVETQKTDDASAVLLRSAPLYTGVTLGMGADPDLLPLALALAVKAGGATVQLPAAGQPVHRAVAQELLDRLGAATEDKDGAIVVLPADSDPSRPAGPLLWTGVWTSPSPHMTLALALLSFPMPGISIDNPGGLAALWPRFWACYNALPKVREVAPAPKETPIDDAKPKRRRVRV